MHEVSIASSLIEAACAAAQQQRSSRIVQVNIRIGRLSGVVKESLLFCFDVAAEGTACEGAALCIESVPVRVFCPQCKRQRFLPDQMILACPDCLAATPKILTGRELELVSLELIEDEATCT